MLYLVATPIGNLGDLTYRAVELLKEVDLILCEDTRHSRRLLDRYEIARPLSSYHKFNIREREEKILLALEEGKKIALISDAGTPGINDPGADLVSACCERGIAVTHLPGPCAAINALVVSGLPTDRFQFLGFLPKKSGQRERMLKEALAYPGTTIFYESPHRIAKTLKQLDTLEPRAQVVMARELTKKFEEVRRGSPSDLHASCETKKPKGEIVLLIGPLATEKE